MIYLDHAASTRVKERSQAVLVNSLVEDFANPSAAHKLGKSALKKVNKARSLILKLMGAQKSDQLIFLSSATEANNLVIKGLKLTSSDVVHYSVADHASTVNPVLSLDSEAKIFDLLASGEIDEEKLLSSITANSKLVVLAHVNNQTGNVYQVNELAKRIKKIQPTIHVHIDGVQGFLKIPFQVGECVDSYAISGHKLGAPKGVAALFIKEGVSLEPLLHGGGHEMGLRSSTVNTPLILALSCAIEEGSKTIESEFSRVSELNSYVRKNLLSEQKDSLFPFPLEKTSPYILSFILKGISSDIILRHLEMKDIYVASSSACSSRAKGFNAGFAAMKIDESLHKFVLRISFGEDTNISKLEIFIKELNETVTNIKRIL